MAKNTINDIIKFYSNLKASIGGTVPQIILCPTAQKQCEMFGELKYYAYLCCINA